MSERFPAIRVTMLPRDTNAYGTIFGGVILSYIGLAGGIECRRQSPKKFVTKAMHEVNRSSNRGRGHLRSRRRRWKPDSHQIMKKPVYVIDAMNYIFRAYHSL